MAQDRIRALEQTVEELRARVERLEGRRPQPVTRPAAPPRPPRPQVDLEDLLGGRVLAWVGGLAVLLGIVFFVVMAVSRGWIDEPTRVVLAFLGSTALLLAGLYLYERQGRTEAAVAAVSAAIAALYASLTAATALYDLVHPVAGLGVALVVGAVATGVAVRWSSPLVAALGIVGALLSPVLVDAGTSGEALAFMAIALLSATGVLLWQRWNWLAAAAFVVSVPQLVSWLDDTYRDELGLALVVTLLFWGVYVVAAIGYELRVPVTTLRASSATLLLANALLTAGAGWRMLDDTGHGDGATAWVLVVALAHLGLAGARWGTPISGEIAALLAAVGIGLSAVGLSLALSGPALVAGWAAEAGVLAWAARRIGDRRAHAAAAVFLALAGAHLLAFEAPVDSLRDGPDDLRLAAVGLAAFALAAFVAARFYEGDPPEWKMVLEAAGAAAAVYLPSIAIVDLAAGQEADPGQTPQVLLSSFWAVCGFAGLVFGLVRDDRRFRLGGLVLLGVAVAKVFLYDLAALESIYRVLSFIALGLLLLAGAFAYQRMRAQER